MPDSVPASEALEELKTSLVASGERLIEAALSGRVARAVILRQDAEGNLELEAAGGFITDHLGMIVMAQALLLGGLRR